MRSAITTSSSDGVAGALAEAVDGDFDLPGTRLDGRERVRRREAQVVVAVDADHGATADSLDDAARQLAEFGRDRVPDGVGDVDRGGAGVDDGLVDPQQELRVGPRGVLGAELHLGIGSERLSRIAHPLHGALQRLLAVDAQLVLEVDVARWR